MKRVDALRDLSDDHHTALVLARRCRRAGATSSPDAQVDATWSAAREAFALHLEPHFAIEERHLLPALEELDEHALARRIARDHAALRELLAGPGGDRERLERLGRVLRDHVRFEEREVFEATQHRLPPASLEAIAEACRRIPRVCPDALRE